MLNACFLLSFVWNHLKFYCSNAYILWWYGIVCVALHSKRYNYAFSLRSLEHDCLVFFQPCIEVCMYIHVWLLFSFLLPFDFFLQAVPLAVFCQNDIERKKKSFSMCLSIGINTLIFNWCSYMPYVESKHVFHCWYSCSSAVKLIHVYSLLRLVIRIETMQPRKLHTAH